MEAPNMKVYVRTPARLHFGLIDSDGSLGRMFGGIGVGINRPNVILEAQHSETLSIVGDQVERVKSFVKRFCNAYNTEAKVSINVKQAIPEHVGLGSGTQLALAVATALTKLAQMKVSAQELALAMGRAQRTGVGTTIFEKGGFVVDGGKLAKNSKGSLEGFPPVIFHRSFPEDWSFVVAVPNDKKGLAKDEEVSAFRRLTPIPTENVGSICHLTMMKLLPSLIEHNIKDFGEALTQIQVFVGEQFAEAQGGTYCSKTVAEGVRLMQELGVYGVGQSSWGPTFYGLCQNQKEEMEIQSRVQAFLDERVGGQVFTAKANNKGAYIRVGV